MACFQSGNDVYSIFKRQQTCTQYCPVENLKCEQKEGETYQDCGSPCRTNCRTYKDSCTDECVPGCYCIEGKVRDEVTGKCVETSACSEVAAMCDRNDMILCLFDVSDITDMHRNLSAVKLLKLGLPPQQRLREKSCALFDNLYKCTNELAMKKQCTANGPLLRAANISGSLMCDPLLAQLSAKHAGCLNTLDLALQRPGMFKNCSDEFGTILNLGTLDELVSEVQDKACIAVWALKKYNPCQRKAIQKLCDPEALELQDYFEGRTKTFSDLNRCSDKVNQAKELPIFGLLPTDVAAMDPNLLITVDCTEERKSMVESCFQPFYQIKEEAADVFSRGVMKLMKNVGILIDKNCERYNGCFKPCMQRAIQKEPSCMPYSCAAHAVVKACQEKPNLKDHWSCVFSIMTNDDVITCVGGLGLSFTSNKNVDWPSVVPKLLDCVRDTIKADCKHNTMDFLETLSVIIRKDVDNGKCSVNSTLLASYGEPVVSGSVPCPAMEDTVPTGKLSSEAPVELGTKSAKSSPAPTETFTEPPQVVVTKRMPTETTTMGGNAIRLSVQTIIASFGIVSFRALTG
jgi:hypothetical protein